MNDENRLPTTVVEAARRQDVAMLILKRWAGCWIDLVALAVCLFTPALVIGWTKQYWLIGATALLLAAGYFPITEGLWGQSLGKLVVRLVVVDANGDKPGLGRAALRTLTRLIEVNPLFFGGVPAGIIVACNTERQRLGDMLAKTYVISKADLEQVKKGQSAPLALG